MAAPEESVTVPTMLAVSCAMAGTRKKRDRHISISRKLSFLI
jgi:hypothetical protein